LLSFGADLLLSSSLSKIKIKIHIIDFFPVVFSDRETWSLPLRERYERRVLRKLGPKRADVTGGW
jgi:hypothetical protein